MWICPTFGRPKRLKELARSWERCQPQSKLHVRLWREDPSYLEYKTMNWPRLWKFYDSDAKGCGEALNEFFQLHPEEAFYGFIADDIVLRTKGGLEHLQALCHPFFIAYPNDTIQRHRLCTHFCIGGDLVREMGWFAYPAFAHGQIDMVWHGLGLHTGLLRYAPQVIFQHKHMLTKLADHDDTYSASYGAVDSVVPDTILAMADEERYQKFEKEEFPGLLRKLRARLFESCEDWDNWLTDEEKRRLGVLQSAKA